MSSFFRLLADRLQLFQIWALIEAHLPRSDRWPAISNTTSASSQWLNSFEMKCLFLTTCIFLLHTYFYLIDRERLSICAYLHKKHCLQSSVTRTWENVVSIQSEVVANVSQSSKQMKNICLSSRHFIFFTLLDDRKTCFCCGIIFMCMKYIDSLQAEVILPYGAYYFMGLNFRK